MCCALGGGPHAHSQNLRGLLLMSVRSSIIPLSARNGEHVRTFPEQKKAYFLTTTNPLITEPPYNPIHIGQPFRKHVMLYLEHRVSLPGGTTGDGTECRCLLTDGQPTSRSFSLPNSTAARHSPFAPPPPLRSLFRSRNLGSR